MVFPRLSAAKTVPSRWIRLGAAAALCLVGAVACTTSVELVDPEAPTQETGDSMESPQVAFTEVEGPDNGLADVDNGTVKQLTLPGPEAGVLVVCDQDGFVPFAYSDMGMDWVGCEVPTPGSTVGAESSLTDPVIADVPSPVGGMVPQVTIPGPQSAITVVCNTGTPFVYEDQGTWVGCQGS